MSHIQKNILLSILFVMFCLDFHVYAQNTPKLEDIFSNYRFYPKHFYHLELDNTNNFYTKSVFDKGDSMHCLLQYEIENMQVADTLLRITSPIESFHFSNNKKKVLLIHSTEKGYRYSRSVIASIYDLSQQSSFLLNHGRACRNPTFSPNDSLIAFTSQNNLFVQNITTQEIQQITHDGEHNKVLNGHADWVNEEEFGFTKAFWWNYASDEIAFLRFDETEVPLHTLQSFNEDTHVSNFSFKYPKVGDVNSKISLHSYHISKDELTTFSLPSNTEYIPRVLWNHKNELHALSVNRKQNSHKFYQLTQNSSVLIKEWKHPQYLELKDLVFTKGDSLLAFDPYKIEINKDVVTQYTHLDFLTFNEDLNECYFTFSEDGINKGIASLNNGEIKVLLQANGDQYMKLLSDNRCLIVQSSLNQAPVFNLYQLKPFQKLKVLEDNLELMHDLEKQKIVYPEIQQFEVDTTTFNAWIIKPRNFNKKHKYPVLFCPYGGPGSQSADNSWLYNSLLWYNYLASKGYIVVCVDGYGTGGKSETFKKCTYGRLGELEAYSQIAVAKQLAKEPYIDKKRIGIWGWSYGGYLAAYSLFEGKGVFKAAIAVAPVSDWRLYDNIYSERYMGLEGENFDGYVQASLQEHVAAYEENLLLIHGTFDDNVHIQHSYQLQDALIKVNKAYDQFIFADKNHGISGGNTRYFLYQMMTNYILTHL